MFLTWLSSSSALLTLPPYGPLSFKIIKENAVSAYFSCLILCKSSLAIVFPSFSHCTSGVGTPLALQSSWTLSPRTTPTSLGISEPAILGGTGNAPWREEIQQQET